MTKDYVIIRVENLNILGHKVKAITERFSDEYLDSDRFQSRCLRCCFCDEPRVCHFIRCSGWSHDNETHFELDND